MDIHESLLQNISQVLNKDLSTESVSKADLILLKKYKLFVLFVILINKKYVNFSDYSSLNPVRSARLRSWRINIQIREMFRVAEAFQNKGVSVIPYKGLCFTRQFYPNVMYRLSIDVDFAISFDDLQHIGVIMTSLGYVEAKGENDYEDVKKTRGYYIDYSWLLYDQEGKPVCNVEFHWQAANSALYAPILFSDIMTEVETIEVNGKKISTFRKPIQALLLICHHGLVDSWGKFRHLIDMMLVDQGLSDSEWIELKSLLNRYKMNRILVIGMAMIHKIFNYQPKNELDISKEEKFASKLTALLRNDKLMLKWSEQPVKFWYYLKMRDNVSDMIVSLRKFLFYLIKEIRFKI